MDFIKLLCEKVDDASIVTSGHCISIFDGTSLKIKYLMELPIFFL